MQIRPPPASTKKKTPGGQTSRMALAGTTRARKPTGGKGTIPPFRPRHNSHSRSNSLHFPAPVSPPTQFPLDHRRQLPRLGSPINSQTQFEDIRSSPQLRGKALDFRRGIPPHSQLHKSPCGFKSPGNVHPPARLRQRRSPPQGINPPEQSHESHKPRDPKQTPPVPDTSHRPSIAVSEASDKQAPFPASRIKNPRPCPNPSRGPLRSKSPPPVAGWFLSAPQAPAAPPPNSSRRRRSNSTTTAVRNSKGQ